MTLADVDILMVTYRRPAYTALSLPRLLETADASTRVWIWHNGMDEATLEVVRRYADHPRVAAFHHSEENVDLREPTNWMWSNSEGALLSKVDDDCLVPDDWLEKLRGAHEADPGLGVIGCWRFYEEDFVPELAQRKIEELPGGHRIMRNCWIEGTGYLMKRACVREEGALKCRGGFTRYCKRLAASGWKIGWYYPFLHQEHMDDPRSSYTLFKTDEDLVGNLPRMARAYGVRTLDDWLQWLKADAYNVQAAPADPRLFVGWRAKLHHLGERLGLLDPVVRPPRIRTARRV